MQTKRFFLAAAAAILMAFALVGPAAAQPMYNNSGSYNPPQCNVYNDIVQFLPMSQSAVDTAKKNCLLLEYDLDEIASQIEAIDEKINALTYDTSQSSTAIGNAVGQLTQQKVELRRQADNLALTAQKKQFSGLNPAQQSKLNALQAAVPTAQNTLNLYYDAIAANMLAPQQQTAQPVGPPTSTTGPMLALPSASVVDQAIARAHTRRLATEAETARQARTVPARQ